jgi:hypothetical protein
MIALISGPHGVLQPEDKYGYVIADEVVVKGDLMQLDHANVVATTKIPGATTYSLYHGRQPDANATSLRTTSAYWFCIALAAAAAGTRVKVQFTGQIAVANVNGGTVAGSCLVPAAASHQMALANQAAPTNLKIIGIALEADTANLASIIFDGINGFGQDA